MALAAGGLVPAANASAVEQGAVVHDAGCSTHALPRDDYSEGPEVDVSTTFPHGLNFYGQNYSSLYVNPTGSVSFVWPNGVYSPWTILWPETPTIAPFLSDPSTQQDGSNAVTYGSMSFEGRSAFCVLWDGVQGSGTDKTNTFQLLLVNRDDRRAGDFDIVFNYDQIQWESGFAAGGTDGLGGQSAAVGFSNGGDRGDGSTPPEFGGGRSLELPGSRVNGALLDSNAATGLIHNESGQGLSGPPQLGRYVFSAPTGLETSSGNISGAVTAADDSTPVSGATVSACGGDDPATPAVEQTCQVTQTNDQGHYLLAELPPGDYTVRVSPPGQLAAQQQSGHVGDSDPTVDFSLSAAVTPPTGTAIGRVVDQYGLPVSGAPVTLLRSDDASGPFTQVPGDSTILEPGSRANPVQSASDGSYGWNVAPGFYRMQATAPRGCSVPDGTAYAQSDVVTVPPPATGVDLALDCPQTLTLTSSTGTATTGTAQTLTAALARDAGAITSGNVLFSVAGANPTTGTVPVDGSSKATFSYTGTHAGTDTVTACYDANGNGSCDAGEASATATSTWTAMTGPTCNGLPATIVSNAFIITGTPGDDVIVGGPASQLINGLGGNDTICGGAGNDVIYAAGGNDWLDGQAGNDVVLGGAGNDVLNGGDGNDWLDGEGGSDVVIGGAGNDIEHGGAGTDKVGSSTDDAGRDQLAGDSGSDQCLGTIGTDVFSSTCERRG